MSLSETVKRHGVADRESGPGPFVAALFRRVVRWRRERRATRQLSAFSDAMLKDIGLTRGGIAGPVLHGGPEAHKLRHKQGTSE